MSWNYRLLKKPNLFDDGFEYGVVEAHYNEAGLLTAHTEKFIIGPAESESALLEELDTIRRDVLERDMLVEGEFEFADELSDED